MATREAYARALAVHQVRTDTGYKIWVECHPGLEIMEGEDVDQLTHEIQAIARQAVVRWGCNHLEVVRQVEEAFKERYPGRAYFIETEEDGRGVQVYQPYGMPRP